MVNRFFFIMLNYFYAKTLVFVALCGQVFSNIMQLASYIRYNRSSCLYFSIGEVPVVRLHNIYDILLHHILLYNADVMKIAVFTNNYKQLSYNYRCSRTWHVKWSDKCCCYLNQYYGRSKQQNFNKFLK